MRVADSASGMTSIASAALASAMSEPSSMLATIVTVAQPCSRPTVIDARIAAPATTRDRHVEVPPAPHGADADRARDAAHQPEEEDAALPQRPLAVEQHREGERGEHADAAVVEQRHQDRGERDRHHLGPDRQELRRAGRDQHDQREQRAEEPHLAELGVGLPAVEHHQQPETLSTIAL